MILHIHKGLPCSLASERVVIILDKTIHEIHGTESILQPFDIVLIPKLQIACPVVFHKRADIFLLRIVFRHSGSLLKLSHYFLKGGSVKTAYLVNIFADNAVSPLDKLAVETIRHRGLVRRVSHVIVEFLHLGTCHAFVEIDGRLRHYVT